MSTDAEFVDRMKKQVAVSGMNIVTSGEFKRLVSLAEAALPQKYQCYWSRRALEAERAIFTRRAYFPDAQWGELAINEIIKQGMVTIQMCPNGDKAEPHVFHWKANAPEQLTALIAAILRANEIRKEKR